tara:strand:+ start:5351 stop:5824 length:474 start_codon:yes stop_codon:yes gene_type:complete
MIKIIIGTVISLFSLFVVYRLTYSHFEEKGRHEFEDGEYCESFENTKRAVYLSNEAAYLFASFYARGLCVKQDIEKAKQIYKTVPQKEIPTIEVWLFYEGIEVARENQRNNSPNQLEKIQPLFEEAKKMQFVADEKDKGELEKHQLTSVFENINFKN